MRSWRRAVMDQCFFVHGMEMEISFPWFYCNRVGKGVGKGFPYASSFYFLFCWFFLFCQAGFGLFSYFLIVSCVVMPPMGDFSLWDAIVMPPISFVWTNHLR